MDIGKRLFLDQLLQHLPRFQRLGSAAGFPNLTDSDWLYGGDAATPSRKRSPTVATADDAARGPVPFWRDEGVNEVSHYA